MDDIHYSSGSFRLLKHSPQSYNVGDMNSNIMPENVKRQTGDWSLKQQMMGVLSKKSSGQQSHKWSKRWFIIKDGWLLYYAENERREIERNYSLNIHPKGILPLGEAIVTTHKDNGHHFAFSIETSDVEGKPTLAAESEFERDKWRQAIQRASRVTWANVQLSEQMIEQLETHGLQMAREKQDVFDRLQSELMALSDEKSKSEELTRVNRELEKEKYKMESFLKDITNEHEKTKEELDETMDIMVKVDNERKLLSETLSSQQTQLEQLESERTNVLSKLNDRDSFTEKLSKENANLSQTSEDLQETLSLIERQTEQLKEEKLNAEKRLHEREELAVQLAEEKKNFLEHADELQHTIDDLVAQKEVTEAELKMEVVARMDAERRLREAEQSLNHLDNTVQNETPNLEEKVVEDIMVDVNKLKNFFENLAAEATIDSDTPVLVKNAIHARKSIIRRAKTSKFEAIRRSSVLRERSNSLSNDESNAPSRSSLRRSYTTLGKCTPRPHIDNITKSAKILIAPLTEEETETVV